MKRFLCAALFLAIGMAATFGQSGSYPYVIDRFRVDLELREDGTMGVEERLDVTFNESRRGIFRTIPVVYDTGKGIARSIFVTGISVTDENGRDQTTHIEREGENIKIRVGDKDVWLSPGTSKTYVIRYEVENHINWFENPSDWTPNAELYWNLTGNEWDTEISRVDFRVKFPPDKDGKGIRARVFAGPYGSAAQDTLLALGAMNGSETRVAMRLENSEFSGSRATPLPPYNGLTLVLNLPSTSISQPSVPQQAKWVVLPNLGFTIPIWVLIGMTLLWSRYGRDPKQKPRVVQFDPPDGLSGPEAGTLLDERVDMRDLAAGIVSLAVKGYLVIHPKEEGLIFKKRSADLSFTDKKPGPEMSEFEILLYAKLKACGDWIDESALRRKVAPEVGELKQSLYNALVQHGYYIRNPDSVRTAWVIGGILGVLALGFLFTVTSIIGNPLPSIVGGAIGVVLVIIYSREMPQRTQKGADARDLVRGFEEFIRRAQGQELDWMTKKHPDQALFEAFLPHAVAFGLVREWAQAFENLMIEMPSWYAAPPGTAFRAMYFASDLGSIADTVGTAASTPPRSAGASGGHSGFGGGGFSGGGFGGGGGGSW